RLGRWSHRRRVDAGRAERGAEADHRPHDRATKARSKGRFALNARAGALLALGHSEQRALRDPGSVRPSSQKETRAADADRATSPARPHRTSAQPAGSREMPRALRLIAGLIRTMRPHQWVKNVFVLAPLVFAKELFQFDLLLRAGGAFVIFCLL